MHAEAGFADHLGALRDLLWASEALLAAYLSADRTVVACNPAFERFAGRDLVGAQIDDLVSEPHRARLAALVETANSSWTAALLALTDGSPQPAEDRRVLLHRDGDALLLVAEPAQGPRDQLVDHVLDLNEDLVATQRELSRRQHEMERSQADSTVALGRMRRLEAITLAGLTRPNLEGVLIALLEIATDVLGVDRATVLLRSDDRRNLRVAATTDWTAVGRDVPLDDTLLGDVATGARPRLVSAGSSDGATASDGSLAAVPLILEGDAIGVLHVSAAEARPFGEDELALLERVGERAALAIGHAQLRERERAVVEALQRSVLPDTLPDVEGLGICGRYLPRTAGVEVGGDFYDAVVLEDGRVCLSIGDVAGKGLSAATTVGRLRSALHAFALESADPAEVLTRLDRLVVDDQESMATAQHLVFDPQTRTLTYSNAGHPPVLRISAGGATSWLDEALAPPLGTGWDTRAVASLTLEVGDRLLLYTDGLIERRHESLDVGLAGLAAAGCDRPDFGDLCDALVDEFAAASDVGFEDDVAVLAVEVR